MKYAVIVVNSRLSKLNCRAVSCSVCRWVGVGGWMGVDVCMARGREREVLEGGEGNVIYIEQSR